MHIVRRLPIRLALLAVTAALLLALAPAALAGKGGGKSGGATSSSLSLVLVNSTDGQPHWGQTVTFSVSTTATDKPSVRLDCYQGGALVYTHSAGFYPSYPWPQSQNYILQSSAWTGGAADCTATLYYMNSRGTSVTLTTLSFPVYA